MALQDLKRLPCCSAPPARYAFSRRTFAPDAASAEGGDAE